MKDHSIPTLLMADDQRSCAEVVKIAAQNIRCDVLFESLKRVLDTCPIPRFRTDR